MAEKYSDFYNDESKIFALIEHGNIKERDIALSSLVVHFDKNKSKYQEYLEKCWNVFLTDESPAIRKSAFHSACYFANDKQLLRIAHGILQGKYIKNNNMNLERIILHEIIKRNKITKFF